MRLEQLLAIIPTVYAELGQVSVMPGNGGPPDSRDPRDKPIPASLAVVDHRHQLLRGLRWWVDAVQDGPTARPVGESVVHMCAVLLHYAPTLEPEDRSELAGNLSEWLYEARPMVGKVEAPDRQVPLPAEALDRRVPVHVAAKALGVSVSTVKRRTPGREGGQVLIRDAAGVLCMHDLPPAWCAYCMRTGCADSAQ